MTLNEEQEKFYRQTLEVTRKQIDELNTQIEEELAKVKDRLAELQQQKKQARTMYDALCSRLGVPNDLEEPDEEEGSDF